MVAFVMILALAVIPQARADRFDTVISSSTDGLAMGDAVINTTQGGYAVFYNPANLASKRTTTKIELMNVQFDGSDGFIQSLGHTKYANVLSASQTYTRASAYP